MLPIYDPNTQEPEVGGLRIEGLHSKTPDLEIKQKEPEQGFWRRLPVTAHQ